MRRCVQHDWFDVGEEERRPEWETGTERHLCSAVDELSLGWTWYESVFETRCSGVEGRARIEKLTVAVRAVHGSRHKSSTDVT